MTKKKTRDYQISASTALWNSLHNTPDKDPLVVMPTGSGKSHTMGVVAGGLLQTYPHVRIMNVVHVKELVKNNYEALLEVLPTAPAGIYSSGLGRKEVRQITFAGIGSVVGKEKPFGRIDFLFVDEAHRISDKDASSYQKLIRALRATNPHMIVIGFTATDWRMGSGKLTDSGIFDHVCYDLGSGEAFLWMLEQGYLIRPTPKATQSRVDADDISIRKGEFDATEAAAAFDLIIEPAIDEIIAKGQDRDAWLIFAQSIEHTEIIAEMISDKGYPAAAIHSKMPEKQRDRILEDFLAGVYRCLVNKDILTTGFDDPRIDLIAALRLTNSPGLWVQMVGRGTRPLWEGHIGHNGGPPLYDINTREGRLASIAASRKQDCLVLDFAGNTARLGPINYPHIPRKRKGAGGEAPVRECPCCAELVHISVKVCPGKKPDGSLCLYEFPEKEKLRSWAAEQDIVIDKLRPPAKEFSIFGVTQMIASRHEARSGKGPSVKVDYFAGIRRFTAWVNPERMRGMALQWWRMHQDPKNPVDMPDTVDEFLIHFNKLRKPMNIKVWMNTKYPEIDDYDFRGTRFELPPELGGPPIRESVEAEIARMEAAREAKQAERTAAIMAEFTEDDEVPF